MSLQVWLPLNGDLHNQGCTDMEFTNSNATINTSGKIGSCYSFNGSNAQIYAVHDKSIWDDKPISICMWYKFVAGNTTSCVIDIAADLCLSYTQNSSGLRFSYWRAYSNSSGTRTGDSNTISKYYDINSWHHVVYVANRNLNEIYVDGVLASSFDSASKYTTNFKPLLGSGYNRITVGKSAGSSPFASGLVNDVRIYDHALSATEVKEISQGLVLHWKLDSIDNNIMSDSSGYGHTGTLISPQTLDSTTPRYNKAYSFNGNIAHRCYWNGTAVNYADNFSYSVWIKANYTGTAAQYLFTVGRADAGGYGYGIQNNSATNLVCRFGNVSYNVAITANTWTHIAFTKNGTNIKIYKNGVQYSNNTFSGTLPTFSDGNGVGIGCFHYTGDIYPGYGSMSDFRIYATALSAEDILALYHTSAKADNLGGFHTFELSETNNGLELLAIPLTTAYGNHTEIYTGYDVNGEITLTGNSHIGSYYIPINPTGKTYYYDIEVSTDSGNVFYIGFQRYDANKTARSNDATVYLSGLSGSSEARVHKHYHGTVDLSTDGVNPCAFISLRILNDWSGANGRHATIHKISLREVSTLQNTKINKQGQAITTELIEMNDKFRVQKNGIIETNEFIEF